MYLLALRMAELRGTLRRRAPARAGRRASSASRTRSTSCTEGCTAAIDARRRARPRRASSSSTSAATSASPVCLEGALKLKEISYIATDAYAAGEMKHGPIALLEEGTPVVVVATESPVLEKVISNMQEVRARGAHVIAVATEGDDARRRRTPTSRCSCPAHRLDAAADPRRDPAAAAGLPDRPAARAQRRPAAQPRQDRHGRVAYASRSGVRSARSARSPSRSLERMRVRRASRARRPRSLWLAPMGDGTVGLDVTSSSGALPTPERAVTSSGRRRSRRAGYAQRRVAADARDELTCRRGRRPRPPTSATTTRAPAGRLNARQAPGDRRRRRRVAELARRAARCRSRRSPRPPRTMRSPRPAPARSPSRARGARRRPRSPARGCRGRARPQQVAEPDAARRS